MNDFPFHLEFSKLCLMVVAKIIAVTHILHVIEE